MAAALHTLQPFAFVVVAEFCPPEFPGVLQSRGPPDPSPPLLVQPGTGRGGKGTSLERDDGGEAAVVKSTTSFFSVSEAGSWVCSEQKA